MLSVLTLMRFNFLEQFYTLALGAWDHKNLKSLIGPYREMWSVWVFPMLIWDLHPNEWLSILKLVGILHGQL